MNVGQVDEGSKAQELIYMTPPTDPQHRPDQPVLDNEAHNG